MPNFIDRTGQRYGRLTVIRQEPNHGNRVTWFCRCDCGSTRTTSSSSLATGSALSCGCLQAEQTAKANIDRAKHGHARSGGGNIRLTTPEYRSWKAMLERCRNKKAPNYPLYGGRGITVCKRWQGKNGFAAFLEDMGPRPPDTTIDRINTHGHYRPSNCRWATPTEQSNNRRSDPVLDAARRAALDRGRKKMWSDPVIRAKLLASRRAKRK